MKKQALVAAFAAAIIAAAALPAAAGTAGLERTSPASIFRSAALGEEAATGNGIGIVRFEEGSAALSPESRQVLDRLPGLLDLDGATTVEIRSPDADPALAAARSQVVQDYLAERGVTETRILLGADAVDAAGRARLQGDRVVVTTGMAETGFN